MQHHKPISNICAVRRLPSIDSIASDITVDEDRIAQDAALGDSPLVFGEWSLATQFSDPTDDFLSQFADAQKLMYRQGKGWIVSRGVWHCANYTDPYDATL